MSGKMNKRTPDVRGTGVAEINLKCRRCGEIIPKGEKLQIAIAYQFYYDYTVYYHENCPMFEEMIGPTGAV